MRTPTLQEFKRFSKAHAGLAHAVCMAQAFAQCKREQVDAYIKPVFDLYDFYVNPEWVEKRGMSAERITTPKQLYLSGQEALCAEFYADCDREHRKHGFTGKVGHCPALEAEHLQIIAENALLDAGCALLGIETGQLYGENRQKMLDLLLGACLKAKAERALA